jgi:hypothetical protein
MMLAATILVQWWRPVASIKALELLYWKMCKVLYRRTTMAIKMASKNGAFLSSFFVQPWWLPVQYWANPRPMAASSGFYQSPGPMLLGNALGVALAHLQGHQNGKQQSKIDHLWWFQHRN